MNTLNVNDIKEQLESLKAQSIVVLQVSKKTIICDYMVLATVNSHRQMKFIANSLLRDFGGKRQYTDNSADEDWVLIDLGDIMVHIMTPEARIDIDLESLWSTSE
jgi:ribosome-associated protein